MNSSFLQVTIMRYIKGTDVYKRQPHSRFPKMMEAAGMSLQEVITQAIEEAVTL